MLKSNHHIQIGISLVSTSGTRKFLYLVNTFTYIQYKVLFFSCRHIYTSKHVHTRVCTLKFPRNYKQILQVHGCDQFLSYLVVLGQPKGVPFPNFLFMILLYPSRDILLMATTSTIFFMFSCMDQFKKEKHQSLNFHYFTIGTRFTFFGIHAPVQ